MKSFSVSILVLALVIVVSSCGKTGINSNFCQGETAQSDSTVLLRFASNHNMQPVRDSSYLYYEIINPGTGASPLANSKIYVRYAGRLMDGTYFDSSATTVRLPLDSLIKGWQIGLPKIKAGGQIKLLVPSALGLGCYGTSAVPPNAPLYFNVYLDSLK